MKLYLSNFILCKVTFPLTLSPLYLAMSLAMFLLALSIISISLVSNFLQKMVIADSETKHIQPLLDEDELVPLHAGVRLPPYHGVLHLQLGLVHDHEAPTWC